MKRTLNTVVLLMFVIALNYVIFEAMPGTQGVIENIAQNPKLSGEAKARYIFEEEQRLGLTCGGSADKPIQCPWWSRFAKYFMDMITFNFGVSYKSGQPVVDGIVKSGRLVNTLELLGVSSVVAIAIGIFLGTLAAKKRGSITDSVSVTASLATFSLPTFWIGLVLIFIFSFGLHWFPTGLVSPPDWVNPARQPGSIWAALPIRLQYLFLPALTLTLFFYGGYLLLARATVMEALSEDYITTARAKGLPERTVLYKHALKNASLPLVTAAALQFGFLLSGAIITETVFSWDGLGYWLYNSINDKDMPVMQAMFYIIALCVIVANFASDIIYGMLDPRIKYE